MKVPGILIPAIAMIASGLLPASAVAGGANGNANAPRFTADGRLVRPKGYYHWVFLTSDLGMSYNEKGSASDHPPFSNVFVDRNAYEAFLKTGTWPDGTVLVKEFRGSATRGSINHHGYFQKGKVLAVLVHVKDEARFKNQGGWAFYSFGGSTTKPARMIPTKASCYSCHREHGAVDTTFVQFYPAVLPVAEKHSTLSDAYLKAQAARK